MKQRNGYIATEFRAKETENKKYLDAYFIKFNEETELMEGLYEEIERGSVTESLANNDIRCLFNHNDGMVLGRTGNGTLKLSADDIGLFGTVEINEDDPEALAVYSRVKRGDINACSFGFYPTNEEYIQRDDGTKVIVKNMNLIEVSIVTFPAYPTTEASARKESVDVFLRKQLEIKKKKLKERLKNG